MKTPRKNITEEIERMKSLFTEERLYGNLVEQTAGFGQTTKDQRKNVKDTNKDRKSSQSTARKNKRGEESKKREEEATKKKAEVQNLTNCRKGINNLIKNFLPKNIKKRSTVEQYTKNLGGEEAYDNVKNQFNACIKNDKVKNSITYKFNGQPAVDVLNDIINNGNETYLTVNLGVIPDNVLNKGKKAVNKIKNLVKGDSEGGIEVKEGGKKIGTISTTTIPNQYTLNGDKKQYFLNSQLNQVRNQQLPNILTALKKPNGKITVVANTGKREKYRDSFEFTVS